MKTALTDKLTATGARIATYAGAETAAEFGDAGQELAVIIHGAGIYDLGWRAKIKVSGDDRVRWLNGMVTNNVRDLKLNQGNYNFVLSPQGRIQARRVTLAPPIARAVARLHPGLYTAFNVLPILRTHVLAWIEKPE